ncbi:hypothetical protein M0802_011841 [Mischocyttarus mexicanus]|nr:hypothetical protein M0802_011841 [Mischocyttarus mexicanus]
MRNGCWRECSSLSIAPTPLVYLSDTERTISPWQKSSGYEGSMTTSFGDIKMDSPYHRTWLLRILFLLLSCSPGRSIDISILILEQSFLPFDNKNSPEWFVVVG